MLNVHDVIVVDVVFKHLVNAVSSNSAEDSRTRCDGELVVALESLQCRGHVTTKDAADEFHGPLVPHDGEHFRLQVAQEELPCVTVRAVLQIEHVRGLQPLGQIMHRDTACVVWQARKIGRARRIGQGVIHIWRQPLRDEVCQDHSERDGQSQVALIAELEDDDRNADRPGDARGEGSGTDDRKFPRFDLHRGAQDLQQAARFPRDPTDRRARQEHRRKETNGKWQQNRDQGHHQLVEREGD
mmetsp:Transcript_10187/g.38614  ORF Transcript_10187/g.38614 Transcript_10187/m.38614 type:complete len:242 (+) Transcript_10187:1273-1998(+)